MIYVIRTAIQRLCNLKIIFEGVIFHINIKYTLLKPVLLHCSLKLLQQFIDNIKIIPLFIYVPLI